MSSHDETFDRRLALTERAIDAYGACLEAYLFGLSKNKHDGEEIANDLWIYMLNRAPEEKIMRLPYLRLKAYGLFVDRWRRQQRDQITTVEEPPEIPVSDTLAEPGTEEEEVAFKKRFFADHPEVELTDQQRNALWYHCREGRTFVEIGKLMGKPPSTVGDWVAASKRAFAEKYNKR